MTAITECAAYLFRQNHLSCDSGVLPAQRDDNLALWMNECSFEAGQGTKLRFDHNGIEAETGGTNAEQEGVEMEQRMRTPGVAVGAGRFGHFDGRFEPHFD